MNRDTDFFLYTKIDEDGDLITAHMKWRAWIENRPNISGDRGCAHDRGANYRKKFFTCGCEYIFGARISWTEE